MASRVLANCRCDASRAVPGGQPFLQEHHADLGWAISSSEVLAGRASAFGPPLDTGRSQHVDVLPRSLHHSVRHGACNV